jgi:ferredoxin-type protein NapH
LVKSKFNKIRTAVQFIWTFVTNSYLIGFAKGNIYSGSLKNLCVPGLNCYSCPGARGACPIGSLQAVIGSSKYQVALYVSGIIMLFGAIMGRFTCGWLCPFGLLQDLVHKIPFPKKWKAFKGDRLLRWLKYIILAVFVILLPMFAVDIMGQGAPYFCKYICPSGIFLGGIPLVASNPMLRDAVGFLFTWKTVILAAVILLSVIIYRPFCKYICPLGAIYGLCNRFSALKITIDSEKCVSCGKCGRVCQMGVDPLKNPNSAECIRCGKCMDNCPTHAIHFEFLKKKK